MKVEDRVGIDILARNGLGPQFLHEEHLVGELWSHSVSGRPSLPDPVRQVTHKVKEEVAIWNANHYNTQTRHIQSAAYLTLFQNTHDCTVTDLLQ